MKFIPNKVHIFQGDHTIVQCEVEYNTAQLPPQSFMYVNDCKMLGYNHPTWVTNFMESDGPCAHGNRLSQNSTCHKLTMVINGVDEAHNSRVYCCARLGSRVCSSNSTISVMGATEPSDTTGERARAMAGCIIISCLLHLESSV